MVTLQSCHLGNIHINSINAATLYNSYLKQPQEPENVLIKSKLIYIFLEIAKYHVGIKLDG